MPIRWDKKNLESLLSCASDRDLVQAFPDANFSTIKRRQRELLAEIKVKLEKNPPKNVVPAARLKNPLISPIEVSGVFNRIMVAGDWHIPRVNFEFYEKFLATLKKFKPDLVVINGDMIDADSLSKFIQVPNQPTFTEQLKICRTILEEIRKKTKAKIIYIEGNHELRERLFLMSKAPEFYFMPELALPRLLHLRDLKIFFKPVRENATRFVDNYIIVNGNTIIAHADKALQPVGNSVRWLMQNRFPGSNIVQGHCHKSALIWHRATTNRLMFGVESGMMGLTESGFSSEKNWVNAFVLIENGKPTLVL